MKLQVNNVASEDYRIWWRIVMSKHCLLSGEFMDFFHKSWFLQITLPILIPRGTLLRVKASSAIISLLYKRIYFANHCFYIICLPVNKLKFKPLHRLHRQNIVQEKLQLTIKWWTRDLSPVTITVYLQTIENLYMSGGGAVEWIIDR